MLWYRELPPGFWLIRSSDIWFYNASRPVDWRHLALAEFEGLFSAKLLSPAFFVDLAASFDSIGAVSAGS